MFHNLYEIDTPDDDEASKESFRQRFEVLKEDQRELVEFGNVNDMAVQSHINWI